MRYYRSVFCRYLRDMRHYRRVFFHYNRGMRLLLLVLKNPDHMHRMLTIIDLYQTCFSCRRLSKVCQQLVRFLEKNNLLSKCQSAYRRYHSTETAVLKIVSDALSAAEKGEVTLLGMLDMSAAFDTVDHDILLKRLHMSFGIHEWLYLGSAPSSAKGHKSSSVNGKMSETSSVTSGIPQGSVRGPILFLLYTANMARIVEMHEINFHSLQSTLMYS